MIRSPEPRQLLGELKQTAKQLPDETVLINTLPMLEAQASSEIENIVTTTDKLFRYMDWGEALADPATKEALRYRQALKQGCESIARRPLSTATAEAIFAQPYCRIENLVEAGIAKRQTASEYLKQLVAIGLLREEKVGRQKLFVNERFLKALTGGSARVAPPA